MTVESNKSFIKTLWDRKVPQYLGTYFAVGFGLLQFVEFICKRYELSSVLVDKYLLIWLALVPAITLIIYFGGQLKFEATTLKWPKILVISNVLLAFLLGGLLFNEKVEPHSTTVELVDEDGKKVKAEVPKLNKVKTVAVFQFENLTEDENNNWYGLALSELLQLNLSQRSEFYAYAAYSLNSYHDALGLPSFVTPNLGMQREIARKSRNDYFSSISYKIQDDKFILKGGLYSSKDGKKIIDLNAVDESLFVAIDQIKKQIFDDIPNPVKSGKNQTSLPSSALITANIDALKYHTQSRIIFYEDPTALEQTLELERKAAALDPTCSECHYFIGDVLYGLGKKDESIVAIKQSIKYSKALPERMQFLPKETLYGITQNMDAYYRLQELRRKKYPYEYAPYQRLLTLYRADYGMERAKALIKEAIDNGNLEKGLLTLANLQLENEEYDAALNTLKRYSDEFPDNDQLRLKYATIYEKQGSIDKAKEILFEEETNDPLNANIQNRLAVLDFKNKEIDKAFKRVDLGLMQATTLTDSLSFIWTRSYLLEQTGQATAVFSTIMDYERHSLKRAPVNRIVSSTFARKAFLNQAVGKSGNIDLLLTEVLKYSPESEGLYHCMLNTNAILNDYQTYSSIDEYSLTCRKEYQKYGEGYGGYFDVLLAYNAEEYDNCIDLLENEEGKIKKLINDNYFIAKIYYKAGELDAAKQIIKQEIDQKTDQPKFYYQMANMLKTEDPSSAREYLEVALFYWEKSDTDYIPFQRALALSQELGQFKENLKL